MPNRVLRDWTTSERMNQLSPMAEVFFTRLIMKADDYGSFHANPKLLKAALFPLRNYTDKQVSTWLMECFKIELLSSYTAEKREYLRINDFGQRLRQMRNTFPQPADNSLTSGGQVADNSRPETKRNEEETETESEGASARVMVWPTFEDFWNLYDKKEDRPKCEKKWKKIQQEAREKIMLHVDDYVKATPDKQYRKHPATYLNNESWNDEIITKQNGKQVFNPPESAKRIDEILRARENN